MKRVVFNLLILFALCACQARQDVTVNVVVKDAKMEPVEFYLLEADTVLQMDEAGQGVVTLPVKEAQYGTVKYKWYTAQVYFEPGKDFTVTWDMMPSELTVRFEGKNADKNNFINGKELDSPRMGDFALQEGELLEKLEQYLNDNLTILNNKGFAKDFVEKEKYRLTYNVYGMLWQYALGGSSTDASYDKIASLLAEDEWLLQLTSYTNYITGAVEALALRGQDWENMSAEDLAMMKLNYVTAHITNPKIKEYLIGVYAISYIGTEGVNRAADIKKIFDDNVADPVIRAAFEKVYEEGQVLAQGMPSPEFEYPDINGKMVKLSDLRGNLVYIDIWATWCGPCQEELPHLQRLEKQLEPTKVAFVSISIDKDKAAWEKAVKEGNMGGIQLWAGTDSAFTDAYRVEGIPRFILIDAEGNILEANMTRPSEQKTLMYLSMYAEPK